MQPILEAIANQSGLRGEPGARQAFPLSPDVFTITNGQRKELSALGFALFDCLAGMTHIASIACNPRFNYGGVWRLIRRVCTTGIPQPYHQLQALGETDVPLLYNADLMIDQEGTWQITEIGAHGRHGLGYSALANRLRQALKPDAGTLPGTLSLLAEQMRRLRRSDLLVCITDQEQFYVPELRFAMSEFVEHGIRCILVPEHELNQTHLQGTVFLDLPTLRGNDEFYTATYAAYRRGEVQFLIPPKPFLGSKGVLGLLCNAARNKGIEGVLRTFIRDRSLDLVRAHLPDIAIVGKHAGGLAAARDRVAGKQYVLKPSIPNGTGPIFYDDRRFDPALAHACKSKANWVVQRIVRGRPHTFSWFPENAHGEDAHVAHDMNVRVTTWFVQRELADVIVTARRARQVCGARDALQLGTIIV